MKPSLFLPLILISALFGCSQTKEFTVIKLDKLPATARKKGPTQKFTAQVNLTPGKLKPRQVEIYDIGPSVDDSGNLVGEHKYYRVVETERWTFQQHTPLTFPAFKKSDTPSKREELDVINQAKRVTEETQAVLTQLRNQTPVTQQQPNRDAGNHDIGGNATAEPPLPTEGTSNVQQDVDNALSPDRQQALKTFDQQAETKP